MWIRLAARRFLRDLRRAQGRRPPFRFSAAWANRACAFIENLPHVEGEWDSPNIVLEPAQIFFVVQLFGFRSEHGRRFSEALYAVARKNAKSTLAAAVLLACFCLEKSTGPQVISAATTGSQARIVWGIAKRMVEKTPDLAQTFDLEPFANAITREETGGSFKPINSKASTQDGLNPSHVNTDEIHAHKNHDLLNVLRSAAGARRNPLWLYTTTEGYENAGPWAELRGFSQQILKGLFPADHFLALIYQLDEEDDDFDETKWIKANPLIVCNEPLREEIRKLAINARHMPGAFAEFQIKRLNRRSSTGSGWIKLPKWRRCLGEFDLEQLVGLPCYGAIDLASTTDMNALRWLWIGPDCFYTWGRYWAPEESIAYRTERKSVPYAGWVEEGLLTQTPGGTSDTNLIQATVLEDAARFNPRKIVYDPWNAQTLATNLAAEGLPIEQFIQGPKSYHPAMKAFEKAYISRQLVHDGNKILTWNMANVVVSYDSNLNMKPDRKKSADKIDGAVSLFMCFGAAEVDDTGDFEKFLNRPVSA